MEMVMKFPNGETPNLLIEVFNYNPVCALQICYTSGFGRHRHGYRFVTETRTRAELSAHTGMLRSTSIVLLLLWREQHNLRLQGKWRRRFRDGRGGGTQVMKRLSRDCYSRGPSLLQSTCQRALQQILNSKLLPIACVECLIGCVMAPEEQAVPSVRACERRLLNTPRVWIGVLQMLNLASMATSCFGHFLTPLLAETNTDILPPQLETHRFFRCLWWSQEYFCTGWTNILLKKCLLTYLLETSLHLLFFYLLMQE